ncbi:MAG: chemotaxis protein CheR [Burkholderiales bacterium]|nr:chemotaxis protein CheR [Burkholderiales bacterium]
MSSPKLQTKIPSAVSSVDGVREFEFTERDFEAVRKLIYQRAGISLSPQKMDMVYSRLARRLRATGTKRFEDYLALLRNGSNEAEWEAFTNALTTNLTSFFREQHHFPILADHLAARRGRQLVIWCCASSTGEEPYSLAMTAVETFGSFDVPVSILATDVDTSVLRRGEAGVYPAERVERIAPERVRRFFLRGSGTQEGQVKVRPELQRMVTFRRLNLLDTAWTVRGPIDAIFCRNVMIYFDKPTQAGILKRFAPLLQPDGLLFVGHSESLFHVADTFRLRGKTVYEKVATKGRHGA